MIKELLTRIDSTAGKARKQGFAELVKDKTLCLAFARQDKKDHLKQWTIKNRIWENGEAEQELSDSSFRGQSYPFKEVK